MINHFLNIWINAWMSVSINHYKGFRSQMITCFHNFESICDKTDEASFINNFPRGKFVNYKLCVHVRCVCAQCCFSLKLTDCLHIYEKRVQKKCQDRGIITLFAPIFMRPSIDANAIISKRCVSDMGASIRMDVWYSVGKSRTVARSKAIIVNSFDWMRESQ